nr:restriction endonuclease subunit S [Limosilactobacillus mucosae]
MKKLNEKEWKIFPAFGDNGLFRIASTSSSIDAVRLKDGEAKTVPYVTRSDGSNGIARFVSAENYDFGGDDGGCITVGLDTQTAFYQPHKFVTGQNIQVITGENLNKNVAQFMVPILRQQMTAKFNWGGNGATLGRMKRLIVMLPVTDSGEPDYAYMAEYTRQKRNMILAKYRAYVEARIAKLGEVAEIPALDEKEWKPIFVSDMFEFVRGRENNMAMLEDGGIPLISAKANNNGLKGFVHSPKKVIAGRCITLNNDGDGGAGLAYYQPANMALDTHVTALMPRFDMSRFAMLFIAECISGLHGFFGHGLSISNPRAKRIRIMLPITDSGEPDYEYMEQYAKNMMLKKYRQYQEYLEGQH